MCFLLIQNTCALLSFVSKRCDNCEDEGKVVVVQSCWLDYLEGIKGSGYNHYI